ncbi:MAG: NUDIX hydrolase [Bacteroidales bacterium]
MKFHDYYKKIRSLLLEGELPGKPAQYKMAPLTRHQPKRTANRETRHAGVLLLIYPAGYEYYTIFIRRASYNGVHSGQISLPGGKYEPHDKDLITTALRETEEEIGVPANEIEIMGKLTPLYIPVSDYCVHPVVGVLKSEPTFKKDYKEVEEIFSVKLDSLTAPECLVSCGSIYEHERYIEAPYFHYDKIKIWGATAMILSEFIVVHCNVSNQIFVKKG